MSEVISMRVSGGTDSKTVATFIVNRIAESKFIELRAIGAAAINQATKMLAIATYRLKVYHSITLVYQVTFVDVQPKNDAQIFGDKKGCSGICFTAKRLEDFSNEDK